MAPDEAHPTAVVTTWPDRTGVPYALFPLLVLVSRLLGPPPADGACALGPPPRRWAGHRPPEPGSASWRRRSGADVPGIRAARLPRVESQESVLPRRVAVAHVGLGPENGARTVDVHIHRLRRKLGPRHGACLVTVRQVGYKFAPAASAGRHAPLPRVATRRGPVAAQAPAHTPPSTRRPQPGW
jgi:Transcriptional regulatory protein, C terminal